MDARDIIAELAGLYVAHCDEHHTAAKVGGWVPMDDDYPIEVPLKLLRLAYDKAMGVRSLHLTLAEQGEGRAAS